MSDVVILNGLAHKTGGSQQQGEEVRCLYCDADYPIPCPACKHGLLHLDTGIVKGLPLMPMVIACDSCQQRQSRIHQKALGLDD